MAIEPIKGFYVHDEATDTDGVAKYDAGALVNLDDTVNLQGYAPDAKAVGDRLSATEEIANHADELATILNEGGLELKDGVIATNVEDWLDAHPEATTTVQDDSLTTAKYKDESVTTPKLAIGAVTSAKVDADFLKEIKNAYVTPQMFGAKADGTTDDTDAIQSAIDYAFDNKISCVYFQAGTYLVTKPLVLWTNPTYAPDALSETPSISLVGDSSESTIIAKRGTATCTINDNVKDAIIIVINSYYKNNPNYTTTIESSADCACYSFAIKHLTLKSASTSNRQELVHKYGIYSNGWHFASFEDIVIANCESGLYTLTWNCYSTYIYVDVQFALVSFDFDNTHLGGNTTMLFINCHTNGCVTYSYAILGNATMLNCSNDGGRSVALYCPRWSRFPVPITGNVQMIACHFESATSNNIVQAESGDISLFRCGIEIPNVSTGVFSISKNSRLVVNECRFSIRNNGDSTPNKLYISNNSEITFKNCKINPSLFSELLIPYNNYKNVFFFNGISENDIIGISLNGSATYNIGDTITATHDGSIADIIYINFGKIDFTYLQKIELFIKNTFTNSNCNLMICDNLNASGAPAQPIITKYIGFNTVGENVLCNYNTTLADILRADVSDVVGEHYMFLAFGTKVFDSEVFGVFGN